MSIFSVIGDFISKELAKLEGDAVVVEAKVESAATIADGVVNALKDFITSPEVKVLQTVVGNVPGIGPYVNDVINFLPLLMQDLGWVRAQFTKSPADLLIDGMTIAVNAVNPNVKATNLAVVAAHTATFISGLQGTPQTIQTALSAAPAVHVNNAVTVSEQQTTPSPAEALLNTPGAAVAENATT